MTDLARQHADGTAPVLSGDDVQDRLRLVPEWTIDNGKLVRDVQVRNFVQALELVNRIGEEAQRENHHPDIYLHSWNHVRLELYTHSAHGLSNNDFVMAARFDALLPEVEAQQP